MASPEVLILMGSGSDYPALREAEELPATCG